MAEKNVKRKMSNRMFRTLLIIPLVLLSLVAVLLTVASSVLGSTLDTYLGKGETTIQAPAEVGDWDAVYYDVSLSEGSAE